MTVRVRGIPRGYPPGRMPRRAAHALCALGLALLAGSVLLAGCTGLPRSSGVSTGRGVNERVAPDVRVVVPPPPEGASPEEIIRGFVRAGAGFQGSGDVDEPVGNAYLVASSVDRWRPTSSVTVFDRLTFVTTTPLGVDRWRVTVPAVAAVDESGRYHELPPGTTESVDLHLVQIADQWRIELPDNGFGLWLSTDDFGRIFEPHRLYYPAPAPSRRLVPDVRWLPSGPRLVTALARAQLGGVPDYLAGAAGTGFPDGVRLAVDAVPVLAGVATVTLSSPAGSTDVPRRQQIYAQLSATLTALPGVSAVAVDVQGSGRLFLSDVAGPVANPADVGYAVDPLPPARIGLLRRGERLERVDVTKLADLEDAPSSTVPPISPGTGGASGSDVTGLPAAYAAFAVSMDGEVAAVAASGAELIRLRGRGQVPVDPLGTGLTRPAYDRSGRLWVTGLAAGAAAVWTIDTTSGTARAADRVPADWLTGRVPGALAISPDGTRAAVISHLPDGSDARLDVAGVVRDTTGHPTALIRGWRQADPLTHLVDVVWVDDATMAVLGGLAPGDALRPWIAPLGQGIGLRRIGLSDPAQNLAPTLPGARWLVPTAGERGVVVVADTGTYLRVGGVWRKLGSASGLAVPPGA